VSQAPMSFSNCQTPILKERLHAFESPLVGDFQKLF
jgi:hypothetical protein